MEDKPNNYGLSRKTNIAIAAMTAISVAQDSWLAIVAISVVAITAGTYQFIVDKRQITRSKP